MADQNKDTTLTNNTKENRFSKVSNVREKFKKPLIVVVSILVFISIVIATLNFLARPYDRTDNTFVNIEVSEGESSLDVARKLEKKGIIDNASVFSFISKIMMNSKFKPGVYFLSPSMESTEIAGILTNGITSSDGFTLPEGYTVKQVAKALGQSGFIDEKKFLKAASDFDFSYFRFINQDKDIKGIDKLEGFLLPDEYKMTTDADEVMVLTAILNQFDNFYNEDYVAREQELSLTTREVMVIASIIQKNTSDTKEMATISSVIHNRRNVGLGEPLPKVPLCSPSKEAIQAALYPEENEYLYYVLSDKLDGSHVFTASATEYQSLKKLYEKAKGERDQAEKQKRDSE